MCVIFTIEFKYTAEKGDKPTKKRKMCKNIKNL